MIKQSGFATISAIVIVVVSFAVGAVFEHFVEEKNHPVEQAAENVLDDYGIEKDFSENK